RRTEGSRSFISAPGASARDLHRAFTSASRRRARLWPSTFHQGDDHMNGRSFASIVFSLIVVAILVGIGVGIYQAGVAQGVIDAGRFPAGAAVPVAGYGGY